MAEANWPICLVFSTALTGFKNWRPPQDYNHPIPTPFTKCSHPVFAKRPSRSPNWLGPKRSRSSRSFRSHCWKGVHCRMVEIPPTSNNTRPLVFATLAGKCRGPYWIARTIAYAFCKVCSHILLLSWMAEQKILKLLVGKKFQYPAIRVSQDICLTLTSGWSSNPVHAEQMMQLDWVSPFTGGKGACSLQTTPKTPIASGNST